MKRLLVLAFIVIFASCTKDEIVAPKDVIEMSIDTRLPKDVNGYYYFTLYSKDTSDIGVSQFITPLNNITLKQITPVKVRILNYGNLTAYGYKATLVVNGKVKEVKQIPTQLKMNQINDIDFKWVI